MKFQPYHFDSSQITSSNDIADANAEGIPSLSVKNISNNLSDTASKSFSDELNDFYLKNISDNLYDLDSINNQSLISDLFPELDQVTDFIDDKSVNRSVEVSPNLITTRKRISNNEQHSDIKRSKRSDNTRNDEVSHQNADYLNLSSPSSDISWLNDNSIDLQKCHIQKPAELIGISVDDVTAMFDAESVEKKSTIQEQDISKIDPVNNIKKYNKGTWERNLNYLKDYIIKFGNAEVPYNYIVKDNYGVEIKLGHWVNKQRVAYNKNKLLENRKNSLDRYNFIWDPWSINLRYLRQYFINNGHTLVPKRYKIKSKNGKEINLGAWVVRQRVFRKKNKLSDERVSILNTYNFMWKVKIR